MIREALSMLVQRKNLSKAQAKEVMSEIMQGKTTSSQIAAFLTALRMKKETVEEITGMAEEMMDKAVSFPWNGGILVDTCGTGGDGIGTFNVSTSCVFVVAASGVKVAKHGNRALSSMCGSADVLEELGVKLEISPDLVKKSLEEIGVGFLYAPFFHPAMKYALHPRREIGIRTVFNILGPLTNPLRANVRLLGVYSSSLLFTIACVVSHLGVKRAFIVRGEDGLDEVSVTSSTKVVELREGEIIGYSIEPEKLGLRRWSLSSLKGGDRKVNAGIMRNILSGKEKGAKRDMVLINSAFCLLGAGVASNPEEGVEIAAFCIDSGKAVKKLDDLIEFTNSI
ncbi:anthranilate phosphoribosyltransferase [Candidatus Aerophobetes bacterium]|nr:anthranilate phosphoribosyltransferase [Candidatus Aerophobetes bacterium]